MSTLDLNAMDIKDLEKLQKDVAKAIDSYYDRKRKEAIVAVNSVAQEMGFNLSELLDGAKGKKAPQPPKYQHPENPDKTWSGRGRQPQWLKDQLADGKDLEDFLIAA